MSGVGAGLSEAMDGHQSAFLDGHKTSSLSGAGQSQGHQISEACAGTKPLVNEKCVRRKPVEEPGSHSACMCFPLFSARMDLIAPRIQGIVPAQHDEVRGCQRGKMPSSHSRSYAENPRGKASLTAWLAEQDEAARNEDEEVGA